MMSDFISFFFGLKLFHKKHHPACTAHNAKPTIQINANKCIIILLPLFFFLFEHADILSLSNGYDNNIYAITQIYKHKNGTKFFFNHSNGNGNEQQRLNVTTVNMTSAKDNSQIKLRPLKPKEQSKFKPAKNLIITKKKTNVIIWSMTHFYISSFLFVHRCKFSDWLHTVHNKFVMWFYYGKRTDGNSKESCTEADAFIAAAAAANAKVKIFEY